MRFLVSIILFFSFFNLVALSLTLKTGVIVDDYILKLKHIVERYDVKEEYDSIKEIEIFNFHNSKNLTVSALEIKKIIIDKFNINVNIEGKLSLITLKQNKEKLLEKEICRFLKKNKNVTDNIKVSLAKKVNVKFPKGVVKYNFKIINEYNNSSSITFLVTMTNNEMLWKKFPLTVEAYDTKKVATAKKTIKRNEIISGENICFVEKTIPINMQVITNILDFEGVVAKSLIPKNKIIKLYQLKIPDAVKRNQNVTVLVKSENIKLSFEAIAKENGKIGDIIELLNPDSKKRFKAKVIDKNKTIIALGGVL